MDLSGMGVPIYTEQGRHGGYRVLKNKLLPPILFDEDETFAIFFAFQSLKYYRSLPFDINIESASRKLSAILSKEMKNKIDRLQTVLLFWTQKRSIPSPYLREIIEAAIENHLAVIEYRSKEKDTVRQVIPIGVYAQDGFWYMPAFDLEPGKVLLYRVDRILSFEDTGKEIRVSTDLEAWLIEREVQNPVRIRVQLTREGVRQCQNEAWLEPNILQTEDGSGLLDMTIDHREISFVGDYFFRMGSSAKVMEPQAVINQIKQRVHEVSLLYE